MKAATSIPEVLAQQQAIIEWAILHQSRVGYFAVLYQKMTLAVQQAIVAAQFEDNCRMEKLIIHFANYYLQAWNGYLQKRPICNAWHNVLDACENKQLIVLQHLILGINTHINLDLAKAAVQTSPGESLHDLKNDFEKINDIIATLAQQVQTGLEKIWWPLKLLTDITNNRHKAVLNFSISNARKTSWANAMALSLVQGAMKENHILLMEKMVIAITKKMISPGGLTVFLLKPVLWMEPKEVSKVMYILQD